MASAREEPSSSRDNPYETGGGGFGKFKKKPYRRSHQATPYDRPPTAIRNPLANNNSGTRGWLSKIVDPAQRFITASAHRFFGSVLQKRLPPPATPPKLETERDHEAGDNEPKPVFQAKGDPNSLQRGPTIGHDKLSSNSDHQDLTELEQILQQKTFTRSEIEHLTALLHSKTVDLPMGNEEKRLEVIPLKQMTTHDITISKAAAKENGVGSHYASSPAPNLQVLDEDIASPAELAKAYMGTVPSKVSPSMLGLRGQALREDSPLTSSRPNLLKSPVMALVPRSSEYVGISQNSFVTPRSRGRSALYGMARTPYARVQTPATIKGAGPSTDVLYGPSSSQSLLEQNRLSGSRQGALKRRSSFLDNEVGSVGPIRRIRQKSNLQPAKNSSSPLSTHGTGIGSDRPSKSSEMATRILEQLDKLVSPKEKSPRTLSPPMLRGSALKSLENVDSSHVLDNAPDDSKKDGVLSTLFPDGRDTMLQKNKLEENGRRISQDLYGKTTSVANGLQTTDLGNDILPVARSTDPGVMGSAAFAHPKKGAFQISAQEDYQVLDDGDHLNGVTAAPLSEGREKGESVRMEKKAVASEATLNEKPLVQATETSSIPVLNEKAVHIPTTGKSVSFAFSAAGTTSRSTPISDGFISANGSNAFPLNFANGDKDTLPKEQTSVVPSFNPGSKSVDVAPQNPVTPSSGFGSVLSGATDSDEILKNTAAGRISFGGASNNSSINNGSIASFSSAPPPVNNNVVNTNSSSTVELPTVSSSPIFKFASSMVPLNSTPAASNAGLTETKTNQTSLTSNPLVGTPPNTGGSFFGATSSATTNTISSLFSPTSSTIPSTAISNTGNNPFAGTSSNAGSSIFAFGATSAVTTPTPSATVNSQGNANGLTPSTVANNGSSLFGSNWQPPKSSPFSSSTGFAFGASSPAGSIFSFTSATPASNGNDNNNDQMSMEDSMAEDTVQGGPTTTVPVFGQQPISTPSLMFGPSAGNASTPFQFAGSTAPSGTSPLQFGTPSAGNPQAPFGSSAPPGANPFQFSGSAAPSAPFGSTVPSGATLFQFSGQPSSNPNPGPSPFQASGSVEGGTGSFSLGTGGGDKSGRKIIKVNRSKLRRK